MTQKQLENWLLAKAAASGSTVGAWTTAVQLANDFTITNQTLQDVTGFTFAANSGEAWEVEVHGSCSASDTTGDIGVALATTGTWGTGQSQYDYRIFDAFGARAITNGGALSSATLSNASPGLVINNGDNTVRPFRLHFLITMTGSGNVKLQMGNSAAAVGRTSTLKAYTLFLARRIG